MVWPCVYEISVILVKRYIHYEVEDIKPSIQVKDDASEQI